MRVQNVLVCLLFFSIKSFSQNAIITYQGSNLSNINNCPQCCNVFNQSGNNPTVGGFAHYPVSGGAIFDGVNIKMQTQVNAQSGIDNGTAYAIGYSFKTGYNYTMTVDLGYSANPSTAFPKLTVSVRTALPNPSDTDPISCGAVSRSKFQSSIGSIIQVILPTQTAIKTYNVSQFTVPSQMNYLVLTISDGGTNGTTALITKVTITETIATSFSISPSTVPITCGSTTPVTFTVNNGGGTTGITNYTWNLGATPNGWLLPDGSAAPATYSTGLTNTLTLTPVCGSVQKNVSATVTANGNNYNTSNSSTVSITQPTMSINGGNAFCSGNPIYSVTNLPCNATVIWSVDPPTGIVNIGQSNNQATLTKTGDGQITLTATITACGNQVVHNMTIDVGYPEAPQFIEIYGNGATDPLSLCPGGYRAEAFTTKTYPQYEWLLPSTWSSSVSGGNNPFVVGSSGFDIPVTVSTLYSTEYMRVRTINGCGYSDAVFLEVGTDCGGYRMSGFTVSPNPAKDNVKIDGRNKDKKIKEVQLIDKLGNVKRVTKYTGDLKLVNFNISGLTSDIYYLKIYDGKQWESKRLRVQ